MQTLSSTSSRLDNSVLTSCLPSNACLSCSTFCSSNYSLFELRLDISSKYLLQFMSGPATPLLSIFLLLLSERATEIFASAALPGVIRLLPCVVNVVVLVDISRLVARNYLAPISSCGGLALSSAVI